LFNLFYSIIFYYCSFWVNATSVHIAAHFVWHADMCSKSWITKLVKQKHYKPSHRNVVCDVLYFSILLHSFNTEYLFFCPSM
jgi:hypothetical protein